MDENTPSSEGKVPVHHLPPASGDSTGTQVGNVNADAKPRSLEGFKWYTVVIALLLSIFLFALDNTVLADVQPNILQTFGDAVDRLPWITVSYALGTACVSLFVSKLFEKFDNKIIFLSGVLVFEAGSALCGAAPSVDALIVGRVICGVGSCGIYAGTMNLLSAFTTQAERPVYLSFVGLTWGLGTVLGPIVGGAFAASAASWRWAFYINLLVGAIVGPIYVLLLPAHKPPSSMNLATRVLELDFVGAILNAAAFATLIMPIAFGGTIFPWKSASIIALFATTVVLWILFAIQQGRSILTTPQTRLFPVEFLVNWELSILFAQIAAAVVVVFLPIYYISLYFQFARHDNALEAGVRLLPFIFFEVFGVILSGALMGKYGFYMPYYLIGGCLSLVGSCLLQQITPNTSLGYIYGSNIVAGLGVGLYIQSSFPIAQVKVDSSKAALAVQFISTGQITGITLGLGISSSVFTNKATNKITALLPQLSRNDVLKAVTGVDGRVFQKLDPLAQEAVLEAVVESIRDVFVMAIVASVLTIILSLMMKRERIFINSSESSIKEEDKGQE